MSHVHLPVPGSAVSSERTSSESRLMTVKAPPSVAFDSTFVPPAFPRANGLFAQHRAADYLMQ